MVAWCKQLVNGPTERGLICHGFHLSWRSGSAVFLDRSYIFAPALLVPSTPGTRWARSISPLLSSRNSGFESPRPSSSVGLHLLELAFFHLEVLSVVFGEGATLSR